MTNAIAESQTFKVPLALKAHTIAKEHSQNIDLPQQSRQVYLNALAVYAVDFYLRCLGFATNWEHSEHQDSIMRKLLDIADLEVRQVGKIECRPVPEGNDFMEIPSEAWENRIAYVAVQLNSDLTRATILGFTRTPIEQISLNQLQSFDNFLEYLCQLEQSESRIQVAVANLQQWLEGIFDTGWQTLNELLIPEELKSAIAIRYKNERFRSISFKDISVALAVSDLERESASEMNITIKVYPLDRLYLPEGVQLIIKDDSGNSVLKAESQVEDNWIQLEFSAELSEQFSVTVAWGDEQFTQPFVV
jgi:Protein of unknown function (DUF1822)